MSYQAHEKTYENLKRILLSQIGEFQKATYCLIPIWHSGKGKTYREPKDLWLPAGVSRGGIDR